MSFRYLSFNSRASLASVLLFVGAACSPDSPERDHPGLAVPAEGVQSAGASLVSDEAPISAADPPLPSCPVDIDALVDADSGVADLQREFDGLSETLADIEKRIRSGTMSPEEIAVLRSRLAASCQRMEDVGKLLNEARAGAFARLSKLFGCVVGPGTKVRVVARCLGPVGDLVDALQLAHCDPLKDVLDDIDLRIKNNEAKIVDLQVELAKGIAEISSKQSMIAEHQKNIQSSLRNLRGILDNPPYDSSVVDAIVRFINILRAEVVEIEKQIAGLEAKNSETRAAIKATEARILELRIMRDSALRDCGKGMAT